MVIYSVKGDRQYKEENNNLNNVIKWGKNFQTHRRNNSKIKNIKIVERGKMDTPSTHIYMTAYFPAWYRHFNKKWMF